MGWGEVLQELEVKLEGTLRGTYRPLDNVAFFRVQYPPAEEREALRQFRQLTERLQRKGWVAQCISLIEVLEEALAHLVGAGVPELPQRLRDLETSRERPDLQGQLSEHLSGELAQALIKRLRDMPRESVVVLLRMGALYPFTRSSALESKLEGEVPCTLVLPYPGTTLGALLDAAPADPHGIYYRGEVVAWK